MPAIFTGRKNTDNRLGVGMHSDVGPTSLAVRWPAVSFRFWPNVVLHYVLPTDTTTLAQHCTNVCVFAGVLCDVFR